MVNQIAKLQTEHQKLKDVVMRLTGLLSPETSVPPGHVPSPSRAPAELNRLLETAITDTVNRELVSQRLKQMEIFGPSSLVAGNVYANFSQFQMDMGLDPTVRALGQVILKRLWCAANDVVMP